MPGCNASWSTRAIPKRAACARGTRMSASCRSMDRADPMNRSRSMIGTGSIAAFGGAPPRDRRLPPEQRAILVFTHYLGLTPTEIADRLGIPVGTARSRLHYAHRAMRAAIEADERPAAVAGGRPR